MAEKRLSCTLDRKTEETLLPVVLEITRRCISFDLAPVRGMTVEEYDEWSKDHVRTETDINNHTYTVVSCDPIIKD